MRHIGATLSKLIGYSRVSTRGQDADRQTADLLAAGVRRDDLYTDHGSRSQRRQGQPPRV
ncbi:recombinase family protein [Arthrobacter sp. A5]|uniref:recombinase family protein n=1 Tax=Arthrobacter sp. A5 TaxID=576926 RepID=UPI003DA8148F